MVEICQCALNISQQVKQTNTGIEEKIADSELKTQCHLGLKIERQISLQSCSHLTTFGYNLIFSAIKEKTMTKVIPKIQRDSTS